LDPGEAQEEPRVPEDTVADPLAHASPSSGNVEEVAGERAESLLHRSRSLQSRVSQVLALGLMAALAVGLLGWYYVRTYAARGEAARAAQTSARAQASGDAPLPALGPITLPEVRADSVLGPPPPAPLTADLPADAGLKAPLSPAAPSTPVAKTPAELALERRLAGPAYSRKSESDASIPGSSAVGVATAAPPDSHGGSEAGIQTGGGRLSELLKPTLTPAALAQVLPTERLLLPKGAFIDCTLETAIDSTLAGMTTCVTATDTFSADGTTVLLERGTKLVGETRGEVSQGAARVFVLWAEARTPTGVVIPLSSPGTDELGRAGLAGYVNRHFFQRFGAAILISVISGAVQSAVASQSNGSAVIYNPSGSQDVMTGVLKETINIPPTITKDQGDRIQVLVARDLDFRSVYELKPRLP
jgi:type IV secretion system protein VirB10